VLGELPARTAPELAPHIDRWDRVTRCERDEGIAPVGIEYIALDDQAAGVPLGERSEGSVDLLFLAGGQNEDLPPDLARRSLHDFLVFRRLRGIWVDEDADRRVRRHQLAEKLQAFREQRARGHRDARDIAARPIEAGDHSGLKCDVATQENDSSARILVSHSFWVVEPNQRPQAARGVRSRDR